MIDQWVVLSLSMRSDNEDPDVIRRHILSTLKKGEVFIPASVSQIGDHRTVHYLFGGYAFVRREHPDAMYMRLEGTKFVDYVVTKPGTMNRRELACIQTSKIDEMRQKLLEETDQGISIGDTVLITSGPYSNIQAKVIEDIPEQYKVMVHVKLRSKEDIVSIERSCLKLETKHRTTLPRLESLDDILKEADRLRIVDSWVGDAHVPLIQSYTQLMNVWDWHTRMKVFENSPLGIELPDVTPMVDAYENIGRIKECMALLEELKDMTQEFEQEVNSPAVSPHNLIIDGHNLAIRCATAPGLRELVDSQGRPTGAIVGFLNSLRSLRKRFPQTAIWVTWDGSSQRRRKMYQDYKANRGTNTSAFEIQYLQKALALLGIVQVFHPEEEADDVIASLIHEKLSGQRNLILTTDKDMLQLVNDTTYVLSPAVGARKERIYDADAVKEVFGVAPDRLVHLRAMAGDTSDNIPGVPRVNSKVIASLVNAYGSIDKIYSSGFPGVSKTQYENLRVSESQVKINLDLMRLCVNVPFGVVNPEPDQEKARTALLDVGINADPYVSFFLGDLSDGSG